MRQPGEDVEPSRFRTVVTLGLVAITIAALLTVPRLASTAISAEEEPPEGRFQAMCVLCHSFEEWLGSQRALEHSALGPSMRCLPS